MFLTKKKCMSKVPFGGLDTRAGEKSYSKNHQDDGLNVRTMHNRSALPQIYSFLGEGLKNLSATECILPVDLHGFLYKLSQRKKMSKIVACT